MSKKINPQTELNSVSTFNFRLKNWIISLMLLVACVCLPAKAWAVITGNGSQALPYTINGIDDLNTFRTYIYNANSAYIGDNIHWKLTTDISTGSFTRLSYNGRPFRGHFDGGGFTIAMSSLPGMNTNYNGFFGHTDNCSIRNLTITASYIDGQCDSGWLIGETNGNTVIENVHIATSSGTDVKGERWGALIGNTWNNTGGKSITIRGCSARGDVTLGSGSNHDAGGLIGKIQGGFSSVLIEDCAVSINFTSSTGKISVGGIVGVHYGGCVLTIRRCFTNTIVPNAGSSMKRGSIVGVIGGGSTVTLSTLSYGSNASNIWVGENNGTFSGTTTIYFHNMVNTGPYDMERTNSSNGTYSSTTRGNEWWGYFQTNMPRISKTGYAVQVSRGTGVSTITGHNHNSGLLHFVNADRELTVTTTHNPNEHQRVSYTFTPAYNHSSGAGNNFYATMSGNNWKLTARVNGVVTSNVVNIPYPKTIDVGPDHQWNRTVSLTWA